MYKVDMDMYALTRDRSGGPIVVMVDDVSPDFHLGEHEGAPVTLGSVIGFGLAFVLLGGFVVYMATVI